MQIIKKLINKISFSKFGKNLVIMFSENIITKGLNFLIIVLLTRTLGPSDYGKYSFIFVIWALCFQFIDFGLENTVIKFSSKYNYLINKIMGGYILIKLALLSFLALILVFLGQDILLLAHKEALSTLAPFILIAIVGETLFFSNDVYLQAKQKFFKRSIINIIRFSICLSYIVFLLFSNTLTLKTALYMYFIPLIMSMIFVPKYLSFIKSFLSEKITPAIKKEIKDYQNWMGISSSANIILQRLDILLISIIGTYSQIGFYNAAFQLCAIVSVLPYVLSKVMLPRVSSLSHDEVFDFIKKLYKPIFLFIAALIMVLPFAKNIIPAILGSEYNDSILIFQLLSIAFAISFATIPIEQGLYATDKPKFIFAGRIAQILVITAIIMLFVPKYGIIWGAIAVIAGRLINLCIVLFSLVNIKLLLEEKEHAL